MPHGRKRQTVSCQQRLLWLQQEAVAKFLALLKEDSLVREGGYRIFIPEVPIDWLYPNNLVCCPTQNALHCRRIC